MAPCFGEKLDNLQTEAVEYAIEIAECRYSSKFLLDSQGPSFYDRNMNDDSFIF